MEENKACGLCGQEVSEENLGNVITYHGEKITLCEDCDTAVSSALSGKSSEEKASAREYLESLIQTKATSPMGALFVKDVVFEQKIKEEDIPAELKDEVDVSSFEKKSTFASFLRFLAWIVWIGGLIISITGANITTVGYYSTYTEFSFGTFLTLFITYLIYGVILMGMATIVDRITDTNNKVNELFKMQKK